MGEQDELLAEFLVESNENLDRLDEELVQLEADPSSDELINCIFRRVHTIKGVCGFLDLHTLESVTHAGENLLQNVRNGDVPVDDDIITLLLNLCDAMRQMLRSIEESGKEGDVDYAALVAALKAAAEPDATETPSQELSLEAQFEAILAQNDAAEGRGTAHESAQKSAPAEMPATPTAQPTQKVVSPPPQRAQSSTEPPSQSPAAASDDGDTTSRGQANESSLRVDVGLLDQLMNLAGELVLARNQILQATKSHADLSFRNITQRLSLVTSELQEGVMKTRMQQIATVWNKFPRVVRDLAKTCGKQVRLEMEGKETELDKTIIEAIKDPLTHIVRNSIDHGIEPPTQRELVGKTAEGTIFLRAFHEGGYVIIEISDDGAGLNCERIKNRALERGLITVDRAQTMSEAEIHRLIFAPGFSTAETVTNISGRGVGMDVVKSNIERIGGQVDISSVPHQGSTIRLKIPLTLAIIPTLLVSCCNEKFAIPQVSITELVQMRGGQGDPSISWLGGAPVYRLRGELLPLLFLSKHLALNANGAATDDDRIIVVVKIDECRFGIVVDHVYDTEEIVVKPLGRQLKGLPVFAGATILGDGQIALIVDVTSLGKFAGLYSENGSRAEITAAVADTTAEGVEQTQLLVVEVSDTTRAAIPLERVSRLEEFPQSAQERMGEQMIIQYRGSLLPIVSVSEILGLEANENELMQIVVVNSNGAQVGLRVQQILDVAKEIAAVKPVRGQPGIRKLGVIAKKVTAVLDIDYLTSHTIMVSAEEHASA